MKSQKVSESRKIRKPMMEKKRRARINDSLETLKEILLETKANFKEGKRSSRNAKLEKADILEMTVKYLQQLHGKLKENQRLVDENPGKPSKGREPVAIKPADSSTGSVTLLPTRLNSGHVVYFLPRNLKENCKNQQFSEATEKVWRPW